REDRGPRPALDESAAARVVHERARERDEALRARELVERPRRELVRGARLAHEPHRARERRDAVDRGAERARLLAEAESRAGGGGPRVESTRPDGARVARG